MNVSIVGRTGHAPKTTLHSLWIAAVTVATLGFAAIAALLAMVTSAEG
jgi:hypothetical protein